MFQHTGRHIKHCPTCYSDGSGYFRSQLDFTAINGEVSTIKEILMNIKKRFLETIKYLGLFFLIMTALDYYRRPSELGLQQALFTLDGEKVNFDQPKIVYFWGEWCSFCRLTSPAISHLSASLPVISIAIASGSASQVQNYLNSKNYNFPTVNDPDGIIATGFAIKATPTIAIIHQRKILHATSGLSSKWGIQLRYYWAKLWA